jgi:hypothetical protein
VIFHTYRKFFSNFINQRIHYKLDQAFAGAARAGGGVTGGYPLLLLEIQRGLSPILEKILDEFSPNSEKMLNHLSPDLNKVVD